MNKKILILVVSSDTYPSKRNKLTIKNTWVAKNFENVKVMFYKSGNKTELQNDELTLKVGKSTLDIGKKNILAFEYVLKNEKFDYLFRTTTTSYVNIEKLINFIDKSNFEKDYLYCGKIMKTNDHEGNMVQFVSGAGILFNEKTVRKIVENKNDIDFTLWDDVGLGALASSLEISPTEGERYEVEGNIFKQKIDLSQYHYRCRVDNHYGYPRFLERYVIKYLHKFIEYEKVNLIVKTFWIFIFEISKLLYIQYPFLKLANLLKKLITFLLPNTIKNYLKKRYKKIYKNIQLRYFKY